MNTCPSYILEKMTIKPLKFSKLKGNSFLVFQFAILRSRNQSLWLVADFCLHVCVLPAGRVGLWKDIFTVSMNDKFDAVYRQKMGKSDLTFDFGLWGSPETPPSLPVSPHRHWSTAPQLKNARLLPRKKRKNSLLRLHSVSKSVTQSVARLIVQSNSGITLQDVSHLQFFSSLIKSANTHNHTFIDKSTWI